MNFARNLFRPARSGLLFHFAPFARIARFARLGGLAGAVLLVLAAAAGARTPDEVEPWPDDNPRNEIPMFGEGRFPEALQEANRKFVHQAFKDNISLTASSNLAMDQGWEAVSEGDMSTAIRKFNQAWLLDRRNGAAYWGFGVVLYKRDKDLTSALKMLQRARRLQPGNPDLLVDYGRVLEESGQSDKAEAVFLDAVSIDPDTPDAYIGLVRAYLKENNIENALMFALEGKDRNDHISDELIAALKSLSEQKPAPGADLTLPAGPEWTP